MTAKAIRHKLYDYIRVAEDKKIKAIYTMLAGKIEVDFDHWNNDAFVEDLDKRSADLKTAKVKGFTWDAAKAQITGSVKRETK